MHFIILELTKQKQQQGNKGLVFVNAYEMLARNNVESTLKRQLQLNPTYSNPELFELLSYLNFSPLVP